MFEYFPANYSWNLAVLMAVQLGGQISEVDEACRPLRGMAQPPVGPEAQAAWFERWMNLAARIEGLAATDAAAGHGLSAGRKYLRAAVYYLTAERMTSHKNPGKRVAYARLLDSFRKGVSGRGDPVEEVEVPYEDTTLPALLVRPAGAGPFPCLIHFDGFDAHKEWTYLSGLPGELARRGVASLVVDHPGVGGALRLRGLPTSPESERWASAAMDWLETRPGIDAGRVGITAMSLGGYYAPRAAAFEKRLECCIAWGARWDNAGSHGRILRDPNAARSVPAWVDHALWVYGQDTIEGAAAVIARMTLDGVADKITCPLLVLHGENDQQVPLDQARWTIEAAVNSPRRDLRVFTVAEGGAEHVQGDNFSLAIDAMADWAAEVLGAAPAGADRPRG